MNRFKLFCTLCLLTMVGNPVTAQTLVEDRQILPNQFRAIPSQLKNAGFSKKEIDRISQALSQPTFKNRLAPYTMTLVKPDGKKEVITLAQRVNFVKPHYVIGIDCQLPSEELRAHLDIEKGTGLIVKSVVEDGQAQKAGVRKFDLLLAVNGEEVSKVKDLSNAVQKATDNSTLELLIQRKGEKLTIKVKPKKRTPVAIDFSKPKFFPNQPHLWTPHKALQPYNTQYQWIGPGVIVPKFQWPKPAAPTNEKRLKSIEEELKSLRTAIEKLQDKE